MGISFGSINTGLPKDIVKQIVDAERIPLKAMETRKSKIGDKKALVAELAKLVEDVRGFVSLNSNARSFKELSAISSNESVGITVDKNVANLGNHSIEVIQLAQKSSAMTSGFEDPDESYIGVGYINYTLPNGDGKEVYVDSENSSLNGIAKLINKDSENGMNANVINDGSDPDKPWRLIITLNETGDGQKAEFPYFYFIDGDDDFYIEFEREAQDAKIKLDGFELEVPGNQVNDLIPGVQLDLKKAKPGEEINLDVKEDTGAITTKITDLVERMNSVFKFIKDQNRLDEKTDTSRTLGGDIILQSLESRLRSSVFADVMTQKGPRRLGNLGVTFQRDGLLQFDAEKFEATLKKDSQTVKELLTGYFREDGKKTEGFINKLDKTLNNSLRYPDGLLSSRKKSLQNKIDQIDRRISQKERLIKQKEKMLKQKFARLEGTIAKIKGQGAGLGAIGASGGNPVTQLG